MKQGINFFLPLTLSVFRGTVALSDRDVLKTVNPADFTIYAFSQSNVNEDDPQVYELEPDVTIRAIGKWSTSGDEAKDYNFAQISQYHAHNISFMGSGTASVIFPKDFPSPQIFDDFSTLDADGNPVPHDEF